ncbi:hypothetical protein [Iodobacter sp.]|uniref:hypothetical protein n=1 Tax=Iodobacter sp. TaxID=1915058 RepID=UPI0025E878C5|nr:hypothetical protein [Iodobacter sp.]
MFKFISKILRALSPLVSSPIASFSSRDAACELGAQLVGRGERVVIQPSACGFLVSRVF